MTARALGTAGLVLMLMTAVSAAALPAGQAGEALDKKVKAFLDKHAGEWRDLNVPEADGKILYDLVFKNKYTRALEIGTSTGHSGIWIAWALSKTGGKLITVDIDEGRYREALANFREAGLDAFIDARLADAHELVELHGPVVPRDPVTGPPAAEERQVIGEAHLGHAEADGALRVLACRRELARLESAVDAIAVETERISEGQRFTTKLLAGRSETPAGSPRS